MLALILFFSEQNNKNASKNQMKIHALQKDNHP